MKNLFSTVAVALCVAGCSAAPSARINESANANPAGLAQAKRLQASQASARNSRFLDELRSASSSEHADLTDDALIAKAKTAMVGQSQSQDSSLFRNVTISKTHGFRVVCGELRENDGGGEYRKFYWVNAYLSGMVRPASADGSFKGWQESEDTRVACPA